MQKLELRFYKFKELRELIGIKRNDAISGYLEIWGYDFNVKQGKGIDIISYPSKENIEGRIAEIVMRKYGKTASFNARDFGCLLYMLANDEDFQCTPWQTREKILREEFGCTSSFERMRKWVAPMFANGELVKIKEEGQYWRSMRWQGQKEQDMLDIENDENDKLEVENYINKRKEYLEAADAEFTQALGSDVPLRNPNRWKIALRKLWDETKTYVWNCPKTVFNAFVDEDLEELFKLAPMLIVYLDEEMKQEKEEKAATAPEIQEEKTFDLYESLTDAQGNFKF